MLPCRRGHLSESLEELYRNGSRKTEACADFPSRTTHHTAWTGLLPRNRAPGAPARTIGARLCLRDLGFDGYKAQICK